MGIEKMDQVTQTILLVDDNDADVGLIRRFLSKGPDAPKLMVARDGEEGLEILQHKPPFRGMPRPDLVVLDLDLPRKTGREVLAEIRADPELQSIPVVVFTTCDSPQILNSAYQLKADRCMTKPGDLDEYARVVRAIEEFWSDVAKSEPHTGQVM